MEGEGSKKKKNVHIKDYRHVLKAVLLRGELSC